MTNFEFNALSIEQWKHETLLLNFLDELRFDIKHTGNKGTRGKSLVELSNSLAIRGWSL